MLVTPGVLERVASLPKKLRPLIAVATLVLGAGVASAESSDTFPGDVPNTFQLKLGGMYAFFSTDVTFQENLTPGGPIGTGVSLEDVVGLPGSKPGFVARGDWNFVGRFFLDFGYTGFSRSSTRSISRDFTFGDATYTAGASTSATAKSQLPYVDFRYGIIKNEALQFGVTLGAAYAILEAEASASAGVVGPGGPIVGQSVTRTAKISIPVPQLGLQLDAKLADRLSTGIIFRGIFAPVDPYRGTVFDAEAHLDWYATRNFGVSAAFDYMRFRLTKEQTSTYVQFNYSYYGPRLYAVLTF
jgi:hypothetical protein